VALSDAIPRLGAEAEQGRNEPMSVIEKDAVPVAAEAHDRAMDNTNGLRTPDEYREIWQQIYDAALAGGASRGRRSMGIT
jgi:hypothetical protein